MPEAKEEALEHDRNDKANIKIYTDRSGRDGNVGAAAIMYRHGREKGTIRLKLGPMAQHTAYGGEC